MAKKNLNITLYMSELIYDFQNKAFITGRSKRVGGDSEQASDMQASDDEEDRNQSLRSIQTAYGHLQVEMGDAIIGDGTTASNELINGAENITMNLQMPSNFNMGVKDALTSAIHDYIISKALADWFLMTNKGDAGEYEQLAQASMVNVHNAFNRRVRPTRNTVS